MNVFLLTSPMQLINALEARHHFGLAPEACVLVALPKTPVSLRQLQAIAGEQGAWGATHLWPLFDVEGDDAPGGMGRARRAWRSRARRRRRAAQLRALAQRLGRVERVFLGLYYQKLMRHFANVTAADEVVLLDDGAGTLGNNRWRKERAFSLAHQPWQKRLVGRLRAALYGVDLGEVEHVTFFTSFDIDVDARDRQVRHDYARLRAQAQEKPLSEAVYFLGQPLVEFGIVSEDVYAAGLRAADAYFAGRPVTYIPHRNESREAPARAQIAALGWALQSFDLPIEYELCARGPLPSAVAGFYTSALVNCQTIFRDRMELVAFRFGPEQLNAGYRAEHAQEIYAHYDAQPHIQAVPVREAAAVLR